MAYTFRHRERGEDEEDISFSQYPRPADTPQVPEMECLEKQIKKAFTSHLKVKSLFPMNQQAGIFLLNMHGYLFGIF